MMSPPRPDLVIPDFAAFSNDVRDIYEVTRKFESGKVADYIPQLARVSPDHYGVSVCAIDGQRFGVGDTNVDFTVQSCMKPINYCIALEENGEDEVHRVVGREPSGRTFNELTLNKDNKPHNPMMNAGAIATCSLIRRDAAMAERFDHVMAQWSRLAGGQKAGFSNAVYLSERQTADRNFALGYFMREKRVFPEGTDLLETLEFYFQCCSIESDCERMAVIAATLANGGRCPVSGERVLRSSTVRACLSLMYSCGMYDFSGEFAFSIGLPAKSGVSGSLLVVVPNVLGISIWSPRLDALGNSVRGLAFCKELVSRFNFHNYDDLVGTLAFKKDPREPRDESPIEGSSRMCWLASKGDTAALEALLGKGLDPNLADYDGRTALHLAAAEGHDLVVVLLIKHGAKRDPRDRWGNTPLDDALRAGHGVVVAALEAAGARRGDRPA